MDMTAEFFIKVSASSQTAKVAGAIAGVMREKGHVAVQAIGAAAINQALKAITLARTFLKEDGIDLVFFAEFVEVEIDGKIKSALKFSVERRR